MMPARSVRCVAAGPVFAPCHLLKKVSGNESQHE